MSGVKREANAILEEAKRERSRASMKKLAVVEERVEEKLRELDVESYLSLDQVREGDTVFVRSIGFDAVVPLGGPEDEPSPPAGGGQGPGGRPGGYREADRRCAQTGETVAKKGSGSGRDPAPAPPYRPAGGERAQETGTVPQPRLPGRHRRGVHRPRQGDRRVLMRGVREYLDGHPLVESFRDGEAFEGGGGVTIVRIR